MIFVSKLFGKFFFFCSDEDKQAFEAWHAHDDAEDNFCELDGEW